MKFRRAQPLQTTDWLNTQTPLALEALRGKVILLEAFQMLCPGCVSHTLPMAMRARKLFSEDALTIIGLHTVFEHHEAQGTREALSAFLKEYKITFPVGIDEPSTRGITPKTMTAYGMQGTPTTILIDREGFVRKHTFGRTDEMLLGAEIMALLRAPSTDSAAQQGAPVRQGCNEDACPAPQTG